MTIEGRLNKVYTAAKTVAICCYSYVVLLVGDQRVNNQDQTLFSRNGGRKHVPFSGVPGVD